VSDQAVEQVVVREKGICKWFNNSKTFGFIRLSGERGDVFVHFSQIVMDGYKTLQQGEKVEFEIAEGPKGPQAINVVPKRK
jgi:CspA family cold shock protein